MKTQLENMSIQTASHPICAPGDIPYMVTPSLPVPCLLPSFMPRATCTSVPTLPPTIMSSTITPTFGPLQMSNAQGMPGPIPLDTSPLCPSITPVTPMMQPPFSVGLVSPFDFVHMGPESTSLKHSGAPPASSFKRRRGRPRKESLPDHEAAIKRAIKAGEPLQEALQMTKGPPLKSRLRPPKQPLTSWQLYFMDEFDKLKTCSCLLYTSPSPRDRG